MVITDVNQVVYQGDGAKTAFPFTFRIIDATDVKLLLIDADGTETDITSDYFVDTNTNTVYYPGYAPGAEPGLADRPAPVQEGQRLVVYRELPVTQEKDLGEKWPFFVIEQGLDKLTMLIQQTKGWWDRSFKVSVGAAVDHPGFNMEVPLEPGKGFRVNDAGTGFVVADLPDAAAHAAEEAAAAAEEAKDIAVAAAALTTLQAAWYDTVDDLRSGDIPVGVTAGIKGISSVNDGGAATYTVRAAQAGDVDDGENIIILDNGNVAEKIVVEFGNTIVDDLDMEHTPYAVIRKDGSLYSTQGMCVAGDKLIVSHRTAQDTDATRLYIIDIETKSVIGYSDINLLHCNSLTYDSDNDYIYCINSDGVSGTYVYKMQLTGSAITLVDTDLVYITDEDGVAYTGAAIAWYDGTFYVRASGENDTRTILTTTNFITFRKLFVSTAAESSLAWQSLCVDGLYLYDIQSGTENRIKVYQKDTGIFVKEFMFSVNAYGEAEDMAIYNGQAFLNFNAFNTDCVTVYRIPLYQGVLPEPDYLKGKALSTMRGRLNIYVDATDVVVFPDGKNTAPFNDVGIALQMATIFRLYPAIVLNNTFSELTISDIPFIFELKLNNATITNRLSINNSVCKVTGPGTIGRIYASGSFVTVVGNASGTNIDMVGNASNAYPFHAERGYIVGDVKSVSGYTNVVRTYRGYASVFINDSFSGIEYIYANSVATINNVLYQSNSLSIPASTDMDDLHNPANTYFCNSNATAATLVNCPTAKAFTMRVLPMGSLQVMQQLTDIEGNVYTRYSNGDLSSWYGWNKCTATSV